MATLFGEREKSGWGEDGENVMVGYTQGRVYTVKRTRDWIRWVDGWVWENMKGE